jgi:signal transduction histidine kinase
LILVVDDIPENRELLEAALTAADYRVQCAADGPAALDRVAVELPDLILLDVMMPGMDGYQVCRTLKVGPDTAFIPIVMITAYQDLPHRIQGIEAGADDFLTKPFDSHELLTRVRSLLRVKALHDALVATNRQLEERVAQRTVALEQALRDLRKVDQLKSEFLANISHELLTPLTPVMGYLPTLLQGLLGSLTAEQRRALEAVSRSVYRLHELLRNLLTMMQWESGQARLTLQPVPLEPLLRPCLDGLQAAQPDRGLTLSVDIPLDSPPVLADPEALTCVLRHLLENAVKFTPSGGQVAVAARVADHRDGAEGSAPPPAVELTVRDTGVGIPPEAVSRIFDRFYQADGSATRRHGGTGLGLAIVKRILDAHGAAVTVESTPGTGTVFRIRLPIAGQNAQSRS